MKSRQFCVHTEKSIEYNRPVFICFIDLEETFFGRLEKTFDNTQIKDVSHFT